MPYSLSLKYNFLSFFLTKPDRLELHAGSPQELTLSFLVQRLTLTDVRDVLAEFLESIGDEGNAKEAEKEREKVKNMLTALGFEGPLETVRPPAPAQPPAAVKEELQGESYFLASPTQCRHCLNPRIHLICFMGSHR